MGGESEWRHTQVGAPENWIMLKAVLTPRETNLNPVHGLVVATQKNQVTIKTNFYLFFNIFLKILLFASIFRLKFFSLSHERA
jgi:hypothetical protein